MYSLGYIRVTSQPPRTLPSNQALQIACRPCSRPTLSLSVYLPLTLVPMPRLPPSPARLPPLDVHPSPAATADAVFPIEICERIVGHCNFGPEHEWEKRYASLKAFSLVCRAWLPFALYCLYLEVVIRNSPACLILLDVVSRYPHRAAWVSSLTCSYVGLEGVGPVDLPVGLLLAPKLFINCKRVEIQRLTLLGWRYADKIVVPLLGQHKSITHLVLSEMHPFSWNSLARLFRGMPRLESLCLPIQSPSVSSSMTAGKRPFPCCPNLRCLSLEVCTDDLEHFTPLAPGWLGCTALEKLNISLDYRYDDDIETAHAYVVKFLSELQQLQEITLCLMMGSNYSAELGDEGAADALPRYPRVTHEVVHSIKSRHLSTIVLDFMLMGNNYIISRRELLTAYVGSQAMQDALKSLPALSQLHLGIADNIHDPAHDQAWWEQALADALAPVSQRQFRTGVNFNTEYDIGCDIWPDDDMKEPSPGIAASFHHGSFPDTTASTRSRMTMN
ncbi:hypothetical protein FKP32DRAFT_1449816 [Trametes sanguinea]|nr:hypothetical protein FKP32DRAFT_1449816 [Trametes sanguinea]